MLLKKILVLLINISFFFSFLYGDIVFPDDIEETDFPQEITGEQPLLFYLDTSPLGFENFGDTLSRKIVERILGRPINVTTDPFVAQKKLLALGSIMRFAKNEDIIWGTGINGRRLKHQEYHFTKLDVRAVRGPLTRKFLQELGIPCPEVYGDPALLIPKYFPEFVRSENPTKDYIVIGHFEDENLLKNVENFVSVKENWELIIRKMLDSKLVISSSLHGIIVAEAFGIPARLVRLSEHEPLFKFQDYYYGTRRFNFKYARSIEEALQMGGEACPSFDTQKLIDSFPYEYWTGVKHNKSFLNFEEHVQNFVLETKQIEIPGYPYAFNPSIIRWKDKLLLCFRNRNPLSKIADEVGFVWLDNNFNLLSNPRLLEHHYLRSYHSWLQDPRLIQVNEKIYLVYSNLIEIDKQEARRVFVAELFFDEDKFYITNPPCMIHFENNNNLKEKNWVPFNYQQQLMLAYSILPHRIMNPSTPLNSCSVFATTESAIKWNWGELRGGTPACLENEEYLAFFHSSINLATAHSNGRKLLHYFMGAYAFKASPPFEVTHISSEPIVGKEFYTETKNKVWKPLKVVFPLGYITDDRFIWVSYGKQDQEVWIVKLDKKGLLRSLVPVKRIK